MTSQNFGLFSWDILYTLWAFAYKHIDRSQINSNRRKKVKNEEKLHFHPPTPASFLFERISSLCAELPTQ
jgi:hypothetical protein